MAAAVGDVASATITAGSPQRPIPKVDNVAGMSVTTRSLPTKSPYIVLIYAHLWTHVNPRLHRNRLCMGGFCFYQKEVKIHL